MNKTLSTYLAWWLMTGLIIMAGIMGLFLGVKLEGAAKLSSAAIAGGFLAWGWLMGWNLILPVVRWMRGKMKGQPYSFTERLARISYE